jgi:anti-sigma factor RsiW
MNCHRFQENLADYVAGRLRPEEAAQMTLHCASCAACAQERQAEQRLRARFQEAPSPAFSPDLTLRFADSLNAPQRRKALAWRRTLRLGFATSAAVFLYVGNRFVFQPPIEPGGTINAPAPEQPMLTMVNEIRQIGVNESDQLWTETQASRQFGFVASNPGGER